MSCSFATDLHGCPERFRGLFATVRRERPRVVLLGGDLLPSPLAAATGRGWTPEEFLLKLVRTGLRELHDELGPRRPEVLLILGNDDGRGPEQAVMELEASGLLTYLHDRRVEVDGMPFIGYSYVPPTPFLLKDWERYDVSRYVDPGCVPPEDGFRTVAVTEEEASHSTIQSDLDRLAGGDDVTGSIFLFHAPPYRTALDRAALDGMSVDHAPLDVNVGSIAIRRFVENRQPLATLHGHVHESVRLTGRWRDRIGRTHLFSAAHDGPELALVRFDPQRLDAAQRDLVGVV